ncbi:MAG TPA: tripartite tricarboxylate transporter substrate binding protein [Xanthobacteraceae bacterium]|nr:tripartite tricarboxylate transporter substrate binding protein [Xanthobacteraceae bacterium]
MSKAAVLPALFLTSLLVGAPAASGAENWPGTKPLKFESGSAAGGVLDLVERVLANYFTASLGVPVVLENRPGAGGNIAAGVVAKAEPDGHTLLITGSNQAVNPTLLPNPGFDYERDLAPVSMVLMAEQVLVAAPAFPAKNITDVIALAKQKPKSVSIAISPIGTPNHLGAEMLAQYGNIDITFVPYDGIAQSMPDLMANRVDLAVGSMSALLPQIKSGALKALAVLSPQRSPFAPDIPTSAEAGLPKMQIGGWICVMTTGGTPAPIIGRLDAEFAKDLALPAVRDAYAKRGVEVFYMNTKTLDEFIHAEAARYADLLKHSRVVKATSH